MKQTDNDIDQRKTKILRARLSICVITSELTVWHYASSSMNQMTQLELYSTVVSIFRFKNNCHFFQVLKLNEIPCDAMVQICF